MDFDNDDQNLNDFILNIMNNSMIDVLAEFLPNCIEEAAFEAIPQTLREPLSPRK